MPDKCMHYGHFSADSKNESPAKAAHCRICSHKRHYSSVCWNKKSRVREIKDEKEEQQFLCPATLKNVYAVIEDYITY